MKWNELDRTQTGKLFQDRFEYKNTYKRSFGNKYLFFDKKDKKFISKMIEYKNLNNYVEIKE